MTYRAPYFRIETCVEPQPDCRNKVCRRKLKASASGGGCRVVPDVECAMSRCRVVTEAECAKRGEEEEEEHTGAGGGGGACRTVLKPQ